MATANHLDALGEPHRTHDVANQPRPLEGYDAFTENRPLVEALDREEAGWAKERGAKLGALVGGEALEWGAEANENPPVLHTHDRFGRRVDQLRFHPSWHRLMKMGVEIGLHALPWQEGAKPGSHAARAALFLTATQAEAGFECPISMTYSAVPALRLQKELADEWIPRLVSPEYDPRPLPAAEKRGCISGMAMTEKQGGSDVRANTTQARPLAGGGGPGAEYALTGHKWFCSAPQSDVFLMLAQAPGGLSCFLVPSVLPDGRRNRIFIQRLKDKLGNRSNASSEIELDQAWGRMVGEEGRGVPTIIEMVNHTRLDCVLGSTGLMRAALVQALHHASQRAAFGKTLIDQPLMQSVLADLCVESEAATLLAMRLAGAYDRSPNDDRELYFRRIATAVGKYWVCKRTPSMVYESLECLGGNGYVELAGVARVYREAPLNSIWEGSGNVMCLDVLRALAKEPRSVEALVAELDEGAKADEQLSRWIDALKAELVDPASLVPKARRIVERLAVALQGTLMVKHGDPAAAELFLAARLGAERGHTFGAVAAPVADAKRLIERHRIQGGSAARA